MEQITLQAQIRKLLGKKVRRIRKQGLLPVILYGHQIASKPLSVKKDDFVKVFREAGTSSLVDLKVEKEKPVKILIHTLQKDPVSDEPLHADFYQVKMTEKIETEVPIKTVGEAPAVKELDGSLVTNKDHVTISCLPQDLIREIEIDISALKTFEVKILVKDLKVSQGVEILDDKEEVVAFVEAPRSEEELAGLEEKVKEAEEVEKVEAVEEKKEKEEVVEGEKAEGAPKKEESKTKE